MRPVLYREMQFFEKGDREMDRNMMYAGASVVLAGLLGFSWAKGGSALNADEPKAIERDIALVDMNKIFASHKGLQAKNEEFKREAESAQEKGKALFEALRQIQEDLKRHKQGTAEHNRLGKELQEKELQIRKFQVETKRHLDEVNMANLLATYKLVNDEVQNIAEARGYRLVINYSSEPVDTKEPAKGIQTMSRYVLYQKDLDITEVVIQAIN